MAGMRRGRSRPEISKVETPKVPAVKRSAKHPNRLTLKLYGNKISAERFQKAIDAFFGLLSEVSTGITGNSSGIKWIITLEGGSAVVNADPVPVGAGVPKRMAGRVARAFFSGVRQLQARPTRPNAFSDKALRRTGDLGNVTDGIEVTSTNILLGGKALPVAQQGTRNTDALLSSARMEDWGTVEGRLQLISAHGNYSFKIYDTVTGQPVECRFDAGEMLQSAIGAFDKRVSVFGRVQYDESGRVKFVHVESMEMFPDDSELPSAEDVYGILSKS